MRVLYFSLAYTPHDFRFLSGLAGSRHEIWFLRLRADPPHPETRPLPAGVREVCFSTPPPAARDPADWLSRLPEFRRLLAGIKPDLVHAGPVQSCGFLTAHAGFQPFLLMSWGGDILHDADRNADWHAATAFALQQAQWLQCDCDAVKARVRTFRPFADDRIVQFPWGVDLDRFTPDGEARRLRDRLGWADAFIILSTRSWEPVYGIPTLLEAFRRAHREEPRLRLVLLGDGSQAALVRDFIRQHGLADAVFLPGRLGNDESPPWFRAADAYLSCSLTDGSSISLLEALATGLPVVVSDIPGNREWVRPGENGGLAPAGNPAAFAAALLGVARLAPAARTTLRAANRQVAETRANWLANFPRLLEAYDDIEAAHAH